MWIAQKELRVGDGFIPRGGEVPLEAGRNYRQMERFKQIVWRGDGEPAYAPQAGKEADVPPPADPPPINDGAQREGGAPPAPTDPPPEGDGLAEVPDGTTVDEGKSGWRTITFPDGVEVKAQGKKQFNEAVAKWIADNPEQV